MTTRTTDRHPSRRAAVALCAVALLLGAATPAPAQAPGLVPGGNEPDALLLHTGDVIGYIEPCG